MARDGELHLVTYFHLGHAEVPAGNHLARAEREGEGLVAIDGAVEFLSVLERAGVVDRDEVAFLRRRAGAGDERFNLEFSRGHGGGGWLPVRGKLRRERSYFCPTLPGQPRHPPR